MVSLYDQAGDWGAPCNQMRGPLGFQMANSFSKARAPFCQIWFLCDQMGTNLVLGEALTHLVEVPSILVGAPSSLIEAPSDLAGASYDLVMVFY